MTGVSRPSAEVLRMRRHRREFTFAVERNLPLAAARSELARERWQATMARLEQRRGQPSLPSAPRPAPAQPQWWQHD